MADDKQGVGASTASAVSVLAAVVAAAFFGQNLLLRDTRPVAPSTTLDENGLQAIDARLWEDPLFATQHFLLATTEGRAAQLDHSPGPCTPAAQVIPGPGAPTQPQTSSPSTKHGERTLIVLVPGGPYEQAAETRRRTRYAVVSALHADGYQPFDPEHLGCVAYPSGADGIEQGYSRVPFERFFHEEISGKTKYTIAVLWVDENQLPAAPDAYAGLKLASDAFYKKIGTPIPDDPINVVGPYSSFTLEQLNGCPDVNDQSVSSRQSPGFDFYVYGATIDPQKLPNIAKGKSTCHNASFFHVINTDDRLATSLADEITSRAHNPRIALLTEIDTTYGLELSKTMTAKFDPTCKPDLAGIVPNGTCRVETLGYLRGLDGSLPKLSAETTEGSELGTDASSGTASPARSEQKAPPRTRAYEPAEGNAQLDYLERLPLPLRQAERDGLSTYGHFTAIGLLGTDVYDKLLLLRVLKPHFPDAIFFTTDLDARLFDPAEFAATRGLLGASAFGLRLDRSWQGQTPSFRDSYQASAFIATRLVARNCSGQLTETIQNKLDKWHASPILYEVGRWGPVSLATNSDHAGASAASGEKPATTATAFNRWPATCGQGDVSEAELGDPIDASLPSPPLTLWQRIGWYELVMMATLLLAVEAGLFRYKSAIALLVLLVLAALAVTDIDPWGGIFRNFLAEGGELLSLTNGISLWPVVMIRCLGALFCYFAIRRVFDKIRQNGDDLVEAFDLEPSAPKTRSESLALARQALNDEIQRRISSILGTQGQVANSAQASQAPADTEAQTPLSNQNVGGSIYDKDTAGYATIKQLWDRLNPPNQYPRKYRGAVYSIVACVLFLLLCLACGAPHVPARGCLALIAYWTATILNTAMMQFLVMIVLDATMFSSHFARKTLNIEDSGWSAELTKPYMKGVVLSRGKPLSDLIDIKMVAMRTACIVKLIYYPFIALSILAISQSPWFDDVPVYPPMFALAAGDFGLLAYMVICLRREAQGIRANAIDDYENAILASGADRRILGAYLKQIREFKEGAFMPLTQQPLLRAILLPLSSLGGSALLQQIFSP